MPNPVPQGPHWDDRLDLPDSPEGMLSPNGPHLRQASSFQTRFHSSVKSTPPPPIYSYNLLYYVYIILVFYLCTYAMIFLN